MGILEQSMTMWSSSHRTKISYVHRRMKVAASDPLSIGRFMGSSDRRFYVMVFAQFDNMVLSLLDV